MLMMLIYIGRKRNSVKKNIKALLRVASKETGLEVNADKTSYVIMSREHNAG